MNVCACSAFRSSTNYLTRYFVQMAGLRRGLARRGDVLRLVLGEGDHADDTRAMLPTWLGDFDTTVISYDHGGPDHGSVVNLVRFANMAKMWNHIWAAIPDEADAVLFVEADLEWHPDTMLKLIDRLTEYPTMAPMCLLRRKDYPVEYFYDCWGFRKDGLPFNMLPPYFAGWPSMPTDGTRWLSAPLPFLLDSAGSCLAIRGDLARMLTWPEEDVIRGVCRQIRELGHGVWLDPALEVFHL